MDSTKPHDVVPRAQIAALPYRTSEAGHPEILLVTSRGTRRWVIPKGWPMKDRADHHAAAQEAFEEAGVTGQVAALAVGAYRYWKRRRNRADLCEVNVYPLEVREQLEDWPEQGERQRTWFPRQEAADRVDEPGLRQIPRSFDPQMAP